MESFFKTLKVERVYQLRPLTSREESGPAATVPPHVLREPRTADAGPAVGDALPQVFHLGFKRPERSRAARAAVTADVVQVGERQGEGQSARARRSPR